MLFRSYLRDDGSLDFAEPTSGSYTLIGSAGDNTYTTTPMTNCGFAWYHGSNGTPTSNKGIYDNFRVTVTVLPKLTTPTISSATAVGETGFTANWTPVSNATGYNVNVYVETNLVTSVTASGQSSSSIAVNGLMSGITYTYKLNK